MFTLEACFTIVNEVFDSFALYLKFSGAVATTLYVPAFKSLVLISTVPFGKIVYSLPLMVTLATVLLVTLIINESPT